MVWIYGFSKVELLFPRRDRQCELGTLLAQEYRWYFSKLTLLYKCLVWRFSTPHCSQIASPAIVSQQGKWYSTWKTEVHISSKSHLPVLRALKVKRRRWAQASWFCASRNPMNPNGSTSSQQYSSHLVTTLSSDHSEAFLYFTCVKMLCTAPATHTSRSLLS